MWRVLQNVRVVRAAAVHQGREGAPPFVYRGGAGKIEVANITPGINDEAAGVMQVLNGLAATDQVVVGNVGLLGSGMQVRMAESGRRGGARSGGAGGAGRAER